MLVLESADDGEDAVRVGDAADCAAQRGVCQLPEIREEILVGCGAEVQPGAPRSLEWVRFHAVEVLQQQLHCLRIVVLKFDLGLLGLCEMAAWAAEPVEVLGALKDDELLAIS